MMVSMNSPNSSIKIRGARARPRGGLNKHFIGGDDQRCNDHSEGELTAAPRSELVSATIEQSFKMNRIATENQNLQAQLREWEARHDEELRDTVQQHTVVEKQLRSKNSNLEEYAARAKDRVAELEAQLQRAQQALRGAESANLQLEKRIEIMSEILVSTPSRVEPLEANGRRRAQPRPRSMLPRVRTNRGSWIGSPERTPDFGALSSPATESSHSHRGSIVDAFEPLDRIVSREIWSSSPQQPEEDREERPSSSHSSNFAAENIVPEPQRQSRPTRRMRRFGGGSYGPKPLILPYTSQVDHHAMTAPPLEPHELSPVLPFRRSVHLDRFDSPILTRPRTRTSASETATRTLSTDLRNGYDEAGFSHMLNLAQGAEDQSYAGASVDLTANPASRNLLEELHALKDDTPATDNKDDDDVGNDDDDDDQESLGDEDTSFTLYSGSALTLASPPILMPRWNTSSLELSPIVTRDPFNPALESIMGPLQGLTPDPDETPKAYFVRRERMENNMRTHDDDLGLSSLDRWTGAFGDLLRSPGDVARMLVHIAQQHIHIPEPLHTVQWWIVGILWRPLARKYAVQHPASNEETHIMHSSPRSPSIALNEGPAFGTFYTSPTTGLRRRAGMAGKGKKRSGNTSKCTKENGLSKHHPLLWAKFSVTLAYAVGLAFTAGPGRLLPGSQCSCSACKNTEL